MSQLPTPLPESACMRDHRVAQRIRDYGESHVSNPRLKACGL